MFFSHLSEFSQILTLASSMTKPMKPSYTFKPPLKTQFITHPKLPPWPKKTYFKVISCSQNPQSQTQKTFTIMTILRIIPDWADDIKEKRMQQSRSLYNHDDWLQHRSSTRHIRHFASSLSSRVILSLFPPVITFTFVAVLVASYNTAVTNDWLPGFLPILRASSLPYQLTAPALALLLVFRTEASYSRFEEGRKAWTKLIAGTNDFARQVISSVRNSNDLYTKKALLQYIIAFPVALKCHLIYGSNFGTDLQDLLEVDDLAVVMSSKHRPRCIIEFISQGIQMLNLEESTRNLLESKISCFHEGISVCEQVLGIPIPLSYTRLTSRFLVLWHLTLPIILWEDCKWIVVPATFISAASLFCIEEVGVLIEEPFPMLALDDVCKLVQSNIKEAVASEKSIKARLRAKRNIHSGEQVPNGRPRS